MCANLNFTKKVQLYKDQLCNKYISFHKGMQPDVKRMLFAWDTENRKTFEEKTLLETGFFPRLNKKHHISKRLLYLIKSSLLKEWGAELRKATRNRSRPKKPKKSKNKKTTKKHRLPDYAKPARAMHFIQIFGYLLFLFWDWTGSGESGKCFYRQKSLGMHLWKRNAKAEEHFKKWKNGTLTALLAEDQMQSWSEEAPLLLIGSCVTMKKAQQIDIEACSMMDFYAEHWQRSR